MWSIVGDSDILSCYFRAVAYLCLIITVQSESVQFSLFSFFVSRYEQAFVSSLLGSLTGHYWTDITDNQTPSVYTFADHSYVTFTYWGPRQPGKHYHLTALSLTTLRSPWPTGGPDSQVNTTTWLHSHWPLLGHLQQLRPQTGKHLNTLSLTICIHLLLAR